MDVTPSGGNPTKQPWTNVLTLVDGTNTFAATVKDGTGKTAVSAPRIIFLKTTAPLTVNVHGGGTTVPISTTYGSATSGALLDVNRNYFIKAIANSGIKFLNWTD